MIPSGTTIKRRANRPTDAPSRARCKGWPAHRLIGPTPCPKHNPGEHRLPTRLLLGPQR